MKKLLVIILAVTLLAGCGMQPQSQPIESTAPESIAISVPVVSSVPAVSSMPEESVPVVEPEDVEYPVVRVVDGDTLVINMDGADETVRLLLVDTPESVHPDADRNVPYGEVAADFTRSVAEGKSVTLELDVRERDQYGRLLAYVYIGDIMLNRLLLEEGHAIVDVYPPNVKYVDDFRAVEEAAQEAHIGLWAEEAVVSEPPVPSEPPPVVAPEPPASSHPQQAPAAGMVWIPRTGSKYHSTATCSNMKNPSQATEEQAIAMGYERCKKCW